MEQWYVYIAECADHTLYIGSTSDVARRIKEHNDTGKGAKYTRARRPVTLRYMELHPSKSSALMREIALKRLSRKEKLALFTAQAS